MKDEKSQGCYAIALMNKDAVPPFQVCPLVTKSHRIKRVCHCSFDAECLEIVEAVDSALLCVLLFQELQTGPKPSLWERRVLALDDQGWLDIPWTVKLYTDSQSTIDRTANFKDPPTSKRRRVDIADLRQCQEGELLKLGFVDGLVNPMDVGTKSLPVSSQQAEAFRRFHYDGVFDINEQPWEKKRRRSEKTA